ncbi:hypothetical protein [Salinisphaera sp. LB1]|uniref:hypothetical protein n=1 Tax=Salinisphaera sp. LB1 TaxID=2183911 RepID=UPI00210174C5|nr:hypothetical protein [Salinisphaera sp. LB1]
MAQFQCFGKFSFHKTIERHTLCRVATGFTAQLNRDNVDPCQGEGAPMETRLHLKPGQNGTKQWGQKYGERLVCVRYRYDSDTGQRHKTVELIEKTLPWRPANSREQHLMQRAADEPVLLRIEYEECELREQVRRAGGRWQPAERAWVVAYGVAADLNLVDRIVGDI